MTGQQRGRNHYGTPQEKQRRWGKRGIAQLGDFYPEGMEYRVDVRSEGARFNTLLYIAPIKGVEPDAVQVVNNVPLPWELRRLHNPLPRHRHFALSVIHFAGIPGKDTLYDGEPPQDFRARLNVLYRLGNLTVTVVGAEPARNSPEQIDFGQVLGLRMRPIEGGELTVWRPPETAS